MRYWIRFPKQILGLLIASALLSSQLLGQAKPRYPNSDQVVESYKIVGQPIENVLTVLSELTGRSILRPQSLPTPEITFDSGGPITKGELIIALESLLSLNGIGVSPLGERFLKVVPLATIKTEAPELVVESLNDRDPSGQVVSKLFRLTYLDSQTFQNQIQPFLSPSIGSVTPFTNSNAVIVTDTVSNLQRLEYVVSEVDKPSKLNVETVFYSLEYAEAKEVATQIQGMIDDARSRFGQDKQTSTNNSSRNSNTPVPPVPGDSSVSVNSSQAESAISVQALFGSSTAISSDERTNQLIVITEPSNLKFFEDIIRKLDVKADPSTKIEVMPLKHADATEVASLLSSFVSNKTSTESSDRNTNDSRSNASTDNPNPNRTPTFAERVNSTQNSSRTTTLASTGNEDRDSQFSNFMTIVADERSNALVVSGTRGDLELIRALVDQIDVLLAQVRIEVVIAEVSLNKNDGITRGMDAFSVSYTDNPEDGEASYGVDGINFLGLGLSGSFDFDDGTISNLTMDAIFNTARSNSDVDLLMVPNLMTTHNKEASIIVGESRPIVTASQTSSVTDSVRSSVQYQDIGIELVVTPLIGPNDIIQLEIDQKIDDISGSVTIDNNQQPIITRRQATSYVSVANGEIVVLGGLQRDKITKTRARPALIGDIPLIGGLFGKKGNEHGKTELLVFIRPIVVRTAEGANSDANQVMERSTAKEYLRRYLEEGKADVSEREEEEEAKPEEASKNQPKGFRKL